MSRLDDRLTRELERVARPADPSGVFDRIDRRRAQRHGLRRVQSAALAVVVIAGSVGGFLFLTKAFGPARTPSGEPPVRNGLLVVSMIAPSDHFDLYAVDPTTGDRRQLTTGSVDTSAAVSPDGRTVAFVRTDDTGSAIFTIGIDGTALRRIADAPATDPAWSPDGSRIAFERGAFGPNGIWIMTPDGTDPQLIPGTETLDTGNPTWSPDGTSIAFEGSRPVGEGELNWDLYTVPVDATGPQDLHLLTDTPDLTEILPSWSPDGTRIVFSQVAPRLSVDKSGGIAVIAVDAGDIFFVTTGGPYDNNPSWSPDGSMIAFDRTSNDALSVFTIRPDGTDLTRAVDGMDPAWQPIPPGGVDSSPMPSPTPTNGGPVDLGLGFPVCDVRPIRADFDGDGRPDTAFVATKMSDVGGCLQQDQTSVVLTIDADGDGSADATYGPLTCDPWCIPFAAPDLNGDGVAELILDEGHLASPASAQLAVYELTPSDGLIPVKFSSGERRFDWIHDGDAYVAAAYCTDTPSGRTLTTWSARSKDGGSTFDLEEREFDLLITHGGDVWTLNQVALRSVGPTRDPFPSHVGDGAELCGVPTAVIG